MNISGENSTNLTNVHTIRVEFTAADYAEKYQNELKNAARHVELPGFRKGHVPSKFIEKKYGSDLLRGVIQQMSEEAVNNYIRDEKLVIVGGIFPSEKQETYDIVPNEPCSFLFDVLVAPSLDLATGSKVTVKNPVFGDTYWERFAWESSRQINGSVNEVTNDESLFLGLRFELSTKKEEAEKDEKEDNWSARAYFLSALNGLPEEIRTQLLGKKTDERTVFTADVFENLLPLLILESTDEVAEVRDGVMKNGFALVIERVLTSSPRELTKDILSLYTPQNETELDKLSENDLLNLAHELEEAKVKAACRITSVQPLLHEMASKWQFDVPMKWVHATLLQSGMAEETFPFFVSYQRSMIRTQGFTKRLILNFIEKYEEISSDKLLVLAHMLLVFDVLTSERSMYLMRLLTPAEKLNLLLQQREKDKSFDEMFIKIMEQFALADTLFTQVEQSSSDEKVENISYATGLRALRNPYYKFAVSEKEEEENRELMMRTIATTEKASTKTEEEESKQDDNSDK